MPHRSRIRSGLWEIVKRTIAPWTQRWRFYAVAMVADIIKMFRQIEVQPPDTNRQLIVWREKPNQPLQTYWLRTVTYGTTPAPRYMDDFIWS